METSTEQSTESPAPRSWPQLSRREAQVATALALGKSSRQVAEMLKISQKTVDTHRGNLLTKLELENNVLLALFAVKHGYVSP